MYCVARLVSDMLLSPCILLGLATATHVSALTDFPPYRILSQMMKCTSLTPMTPYGPSKTCTKDDAFRNYEEVAAELLLDVRQGGVALGSNKITKSGITTFRTHNAILLRPLHALQLVQP